MAHLEPACSAVTVMRNGLHGQPVRILMRAMEAASTAATCWTVVSTPREVGQLFITTGPACKMSDIEIQRAEAHGIPLGLEYRKVNVILKHNPTAFLPGTNLKLANLKISTPVNSRFCGYMPRVYKGSPCYCCIGLTLSILTANH